MLPLPRVLVVDDDKRHSDAISDALRRVGIECVPALYDGENPASLHPAMRGIRVLLSDLHLIPLSQTTNITAICQPLVELIEGGISAGTPYVLVLWTGHPKELDEVRAHLAGRIPDTHKPLGVYALDKGAHLGTDHAVIDASKLAEALMTALREMPASAAILEWEEMLAKASRAAIDELHSMVQDTKGTMGYQRGLSTLLLRFAERALGKVHADKRPAAGVSEVLIPVISDALSIMVESASNDVWKKALKGANPGANPDIAGLMNGRLHIGGPKDHGVDVNKSEPGSVLQLPQGLADEPRHKAVFGQSWQDAKKTILRNCPEMDAFPCTQVLVRLEAPCDHAQGTVGSQLYALGAVIQIEHRKSGLPKYWWCSRPLRRDDVAVLRGGDKLLMVNLRALFIPVGAELDAAAVLFRLRPPLVSSLAFSFGERVMRPGIIEFQ